VASSCWRTETLQFREKRGIPWTARGIFLSLLMGFVCWSSKRYIMSDNTPRRAASSCVLIGHNVLRLGSKYNYEWAECIITVY